MANRESKRLIDLVDGIQGTWVDTITEGVQSQDPNLENPCRIKYIPDVDVFKHPVKALKMMFGAKPTEVSNSVYPKEAVKHKVLDHTEEGVPERVVVILEDEMGNQPLLEKLGMEFEGSISKISKKLSETEKESLHKDIEKMESQDEEKRESSEPSSRSRRRGGMDRDRMEDFF